MTNSKLYPGAGTMAKGRKAWFVKTGEFREPLAGDYFLSGAIPEAYLAEHDIGTKYHILVRSNRSVCSKCGSVRPS